MKCTLCNKNDASVFYREIINGNEKKYALCPDCAAKKEMGVYGTSLFEKSLFDNFFAMPAHNGKKQEEKRCSLCASTFKDLQKMGKAGCPVCYETFERELSQTLGRLHGDSTHKGMIPERLKTCETPEDKLSQLEKELRVAISEENYEEAAILRDRIREMKGMD